MSKEKTIRNVEFDKWWANFQIIYSVSAESKKLARVAWDNAWKTCSGKIVEAVREYKHPIEL